MPASDVILNSFQARYRRLSNVDCNADDCAQNFWMHTANHENAAVFENEKKRQRCLGEVFESDVDPSPVTRCDCHSQLAVPKDLPARKKRRSPGKIEENKIKGG